MLDTLQATNNNYTVKQIFKENWDDFRIIYNGNIRQSVLDNVEKIMNCGNADVLGYNKEENIVKFSFKDKETKTEKIASMSVDIFIGYLVRHIPGKAFK